MVYHMLLVTLCRYFAFSTLVAFLITIENKVILLQSPKGLFAWIRFKAWRIPETRFVDLSQAAALSLKFLKKDIAKKDSCQLLSCM